MKLRLSKLRTQLSEKDEQLKVLASESRFHRFIAHKTMLTGVSGEAIIAAAIGGEMTPYNANYDVRRDRIRIEVKTSNLRRPSLYSNTLRWSWNKIFGENGGKKYDFLILVAQKDQPSQHSHRDMTNECLYFCLPWAQLKQFTIRSGRHQMIQLPLNSEMLEDFRMTFGELLNHPFAAQIT